MKFCEDCGKQTVVRAECPICQRLVCYYCWSHNHGLQMERARRNCDALTAKR